MRIDRKLNLVIPLYDAEVVRMDEKTGKPLIGADGKAVTFLPVRMHVHSTPISREVFEANFLLISKTFAAIYNGGLGFTVGPRVAALQLAKTAADSGEPESALALMNEVRRLSNVIAPGPQGWTAVPLQTVLDEKLIDGDERSEVENAIVFFTVASAVHRKTEIASVLEGACQLWGGRTESLNSTEFAASLPTSMPAATTGETAKPSSIPS